MTNAVLLPAAIPLTLPMGELQILAFIYDSGYTLKADSALARIGNIPRTQVAGLIEKWEKKGWVNVRRSKFTGGKAARWIIAAM